MSLTLNLTSYNNDVAPGPDSMRYLGPNHAWNKNDFVQVSRTAPKISPDGTGYNGKGRARFKLVRTAIGPFSLGMGDMILELSLSVPTDTTNTAEHDAMIDDVAAWLATQSAKDLLLSHDLVQ